MPIISVSLSKGLVEEMNTLQKKLKFSGRSELIRAALRLLIEESETSPNDGEQDAIILVVHDDKLSITAIRHEYEHIIKTHIHHHLKTDVCSELLLLRGQVEDIRNIYNSLRKEKNIEMVKIFFV